VDADVTTAAWEEVLRLPQWDGDPVWVHSDLLPGNLLVRQGRLSALIDCFGLTAEHYYRVKNPVLAGIGLHAVSQALADHQHGT
jgi:hypothetical protein